MEKLERLNLNSSVNLIQRFLLGTLPQGNDVITPYSRDFDKSLYVKSQALLLSNLGSKNNSLIEVHRALLQCR